MSKVIKIEGKRSVTVVSADSSNDFISKNDAEMDKRAKAAVRSAISRAETCRKPVARYDRKSGKAYIETADGAKKYV